MLTGIAIAAALGSALVEEADRLNLAYTQCLFEQVRASREARLPETTMLARLDSACEAERIALETVTIAIGQQRGESETQARANWSRVHANSIEAVRRAYSLRLDEQQP
ncbi:hypothetical protein [Aurantiacibacter odishensis]|uniref:hypothetical protein n=1 Tax=Aurantiacibacter odishensis TaxID=1155476 RepID=UPI000E7391E1|nr:hypothetical protein [Aurantiacibacter odishensis]